MKLKTVLVLVFAFLFLAVSMAQAQKLLCISEQSLKGEETVNSCLAKGERFAIVDQFGLVRILSPEEIALSKAMNPKIFEARAYGVKYIQLAPPLPPLPVPSYVGG